MVKSGGQGFLYKGLHDDQVYLLVDSISTAMSTGMYVGPLDTQNAIPIMINRCPRLFYPLFLYYRTPHSVPECISQLHDRYSAV